MEWPHGPNNAEEAKTRDVGGLVSLEGIQYLTNLVDLRFPNNQVSDLSPLRNLTNLEILYLGDVCSGCALASGGNLVSDLAPLQNLTNLEYLSFSDNQVTSLTPLQNLTNLQVLDFDNNQVTSLTPLQNLTNLYSLDFDNNQASDLTPLQNLTNLDSLDFDNNQVTSLMPLENLTNLYYLRFINNQVTSLTPLQNLTSLAHLYFDNNQVTSLTPLENLPNLWYLTFSYNEVLTLTPLENLTNLEGLSFSNNQVSNLTPLQNLTNLQYLSFSNNQVTSLTPLQNLTNLVYLDFSNNQVTTLTPLQNLTNLQYLYFYNNQVSDITPLVNNPGIGSGDNVDMRYNYLDLTPGSQNMQDINTLLSRGCTVSYYPQNSTDDIYEPDNTMQQAKYISFNETQDHILADEDWVYFYSNQARSVVIETLNLQDVDTFLKLYDSTGILLASDDDGGGGWASKILYTLPSAGNYYVRISDYTNRSVQEQGIEKENTGSSRYSSSSSYQVRLSESSSSSSIRFKIANSWGIGGWENIPDGFVYMTDQALIVNNIDTFFYLPKSNYQPKMVAVFKMTHPIRSDCVLTVGVGNPNSPRQSKAVYGANDFGGPYYCAGGPWPFPNNRIVVDITEFLPLQSETVFLKVYDSNDSSLTGTVEYFAVETYTSYPNSLATRYIASGLPLNTSNNTTLTIQIPTLSFSSESRDSASDMSDLLYLASEAVTPEMVYSSFPELQTNRDAPQVEMYGTYGTGLRHPTAEEWEKIIADGSIRKVDSKKLLELAKATISRGTIDLSQSQYFPPIGNQGSKGSCGSFSMGYYIATYYLARKYNWNLYGASWEGGDYGAPTAAYQDYIMSPDFLYHQILAYNTEETTWGTTYQDNMTVLTNIGISAWRKMPYDLSTHQTWPSEDAWRQAPLNRFEYYGSPNNIIYWIPVSDVSDIQSLQYLLESGIMISVSINAGNYQYLNSEDLWDINTYLLEGSNHANTIVGYISQ